MSRHVEKTLKAKLHQPTATKQERLEYLYTEWNQCLDDHNEGISYADRQKEYDIHSIYVQDVKRVDSNDNTEHPVYIRSQGLKIECTDNSIATYFAGIPIEPYERIWLPLGLGPRQQRQLQKGEVRGSLICKHSDGFYMHITLRLPAEPDRLPADPTFIGIDVGETNSLASVALSNRKPTNGRFWSGSEYKRINKKYGDIRRRLQERGADTLIEQVKDEQYRKLDDLRHKQTCELVAYAEQYEDPVIVMEDLTDIRNNIDYGTEMNRRLHGWAFRKLQTYIEYKAKERGIPVIYVDSRNTSQKCHNCLYKGRRNGSEFRCTNDACPITQYHADLNAAINIAHRGAFHSAENADLGKERYDDSTVDGAPLTVLQPRTCASTPTRRAPVMKQCTG